MTDNLVQHWEQVADLVDKDDFGAEIVKQVGG